MKRVLIVILVFLQVQSVAWADMSWIEQYRNSSQRDMCMSESFDRKIDAIILEDIPSILEECGIGGLFDFCGKLGKLGQIFGKYLGCGGGGGWGGSNFCDWGFDARTAKEAWKVYRRSIYTAIEQSEPSNGKSHQSSQLALDKKRYESLGLAPN